MSDKTVTLEDVLLETMPFGEQLLEWCKKNPKFQQALKIVYSDKFLHLGGIITSYSPNYPDDEIIGIISYDYTRKNPLFKQDFIVNKNSNNEEFVLFTRNPFGSSKYVKDINEFFRTYGENGFYKDSHHLSFDDLPDEFKDRGKRTIKLAEKIIKAGGYRPSQKKIERIYQEVRAEKQNKWMTKKPLN